MAADQAFVYTIHTPGSVTCNDVAGNRLTKGTNSTHTCPGT